MEERHTKYNPRYESFGYGTKSAKVYGYARRGHRENWKHHYVEVHRDSKGRFISYKKWSPKEPIGKPEYVEKWIKARTGKELYQEVREEYGKYEWVDFDVKSP